MAAYNRTLLGTNGDDDDSEKSLDDFSPFSIAKSITKANEKEKEKQKKELKAKEKKIRSKMQQVKAKQEEKKLKKQEELENSITSSIQLYNGSTSGVESSFSALDISQALIVDSERLLEEVMKLTDPGVIDLAPKDDASFVSQMDSIRAGKEKEKQKERDAFLAMKKKKEEKKRKKAGEKKDDKEKKEKKSSDGKEKDKKPKDDKDKENKEKDDKNMEKKKSKDEKEKEKKEQEEKKKKEEEKMKKEKEERSRIKEDAARNFKEREKEHKQFVKQKRESEKERKKAEKEKKKLEKVIGDESEVPSLDGSAHTRALGIFMPSALKRGSSTPQKKERLRSYNSIKPRTDMLALWGTDASSKHN